MAVDKKLSGALQENILTLLCFDKEACPVVIAAIEPELFESAVYRNVADAAIAYFRKYKKPAAEHLPDLLEEHLSGKKASAKLYGDLLNDLYSIKDDINRKYVLDQLQSFVRQQSIRRSIILAADELQQGRLDSAERIITEGVKKRITVFDKGLTVGQAIESTSLYDPSQEMVNTGIPPLDRDGICPSPGELYTVLASPNRGKTWWLQSIGKFAALQRKKVLHITLEMSEEKIARRYVQSFFAMTRRPEQFKVPEIQVDKSGRFTGLRFKNQRKRPSLLDPKARRRLTTRAKTFGQKFQRILVKQFPTSALSTDGLYGYLEMLELEEGFSPDVVIVDYADLMKIDVANMRIDTGRVYKDLRGLAVDHNLAVVTASQSNRQGEDAKILTMKNFAEDYSKAAISDNIVSYNQTKEEKELGLARLFVVKARDEASGQTVLITQAYASGQFSLDSVRLGNAKDYWNEVERQ
jgi:replicative DNA helicase